MAIEEHGRPDTDRHEGPLQRFRCSSCGYGISCRQPPEACPMCAAKTWLAHRRTPLDFLHDLNPAFRAEASQGIRVLDADLPLTRGVVAESSGETRA